MASITLKNVPDSLMRRLRKLAESQRRSVTQQALYLIEGGLSETETSEERAATAQLAVWRELAGRWESDRTAREETKDLYEARTSGREVDL